MPDIIESNPEILGGKPIIKGTRIPVALIYELIGLNYSISEILKEYPHLNRDVIVTILNIGKDANENLANVDIDAIISKEV
ncbi:MAG: antitoxin [Promethearchaeota archaeon Loki_b32]|nr:MAG: antitoxin [Candidatus Lokiarchaeota archaeon Loki_b32]